MAYENLQPHSAAVIAWRRDGVSLKDCVDRLRSEQGVETSIGTLSRFLKETAPAHGLRSATPQEGLSIDIASIVAELFAEVRTLKEENRKALEHLSGQIRVATETAKGKTATTSYDKKKQRQTFFTGLSVGVFLSLLLVGAGVGLMIYLRYQSQ
ncbi:hypothetical protein [Ponticaulis sp.]|uniref:hypothetical protein n=1 Tax=Ponticaulis sp. TaxID=2020902 RepID=UPI000C45DA56|nr:hypothetical protein [Ponticaulis sp.]MAF58815.1 hypothetical protein [Ponticaulis sp.]MBN04109.1 hypothetical protein [Ponticaulis sp.]MBN05749.1 hypothetical protein [Ponticaulis sp.]|tara:strand:- start:83 stop:544 length:462 start_codon:yes stop_codon:yes gene_type:complete